MFATCIIGGRRPVGLCGADTRELGYGLHNVIVRARETKRYGLSKNWIFVILGPPKVQKVDSRHPLGGLWEAFGSPFGPFVTPWCGCSLLATFASSQLFA